MCNFTFMINLKCFKNAIIITPEVLEDFFLLEIQHFKN